MWQHVQCLSRSVPEIHSHVAGTLSNQPANFCMDIYKGIVANFMKVDNRVPSDFNATRGVTVCTSAFLACHRATRGVTVCTAAFLACHRATRGVTVCTAAFLACHRATRGVTVCTAAFLACHRATRGVTVCTAALLACHQCYCAGSSLAWGLNFPAVVCGIL